MYWSPLLLLPITILAATCPDCPVGGIWSDWATTETCNATCGACANRTYTRTCLSDAMTNCKCDGPKIQSMPCNTQACNWPRFNSSRENCCFNKTTMTIKNWVHCVPLPDIYALPCCPDNGYWSTWSGWSKVANQASWQRTRVCLSGGHNCPCKGEAVDLKHSCPCAPVDVITNVTTTCAINDDKNDPFSVRKPVFLGSRCLTQVVIEISSFRQAFWTQRSSRIFEGRIGWIDSTGQCLQATITREDVETTQATTINQLILKQQYEIERQGDHHLPKALHRHPFIKKIVRNHVRVLVYYGDTDMACNFMMGQQFVDQLGLRRTLKKTPLKFDRQIAGFKTLFDGLSFITIRGAGHMAPQWRAPHMYYAVQQFLLNHPL
ncbi:hypothetical protein CRE_23802 [Caenorhabditis remanei]|uniref:Uncharacterized protein n=1 Tax=Caenorhabditis remanei TaxID=31234 RepID=E3NPZ8_CAERE|nr:hypothetical protein CRE_23802 [Caenorhabditis remanei]